MPEDSALGPGEAVSSLPVRLRICRHERVLVAVAPLDGHTNKVTAVCLDCLRPVSLQWLVAELKSAEMPARRAAQGIPRCGFAL